MKHKPIIFLAFANDRADGGDYLRNLPKEQKLIRAALEQAARDGLCEYVERPNATPDEIFNVFQDPAHRDRIAVFHFGGHANSYQLILESQEGDAKAADARGVAAFLGQQRGLQLIFLNGCSTRGHTDELLASNVSAVISTSQAISDSTATEFAARFYRGLAGGASVERAYREAEAAARIANDGDFRNAYVADAPPDERWPWELHVKQGAEITGGWNLPETVGNPLFTLPPLAPADLPDEPFRHLHWFTRKDAEVFFGRSYQIREVYYRVTDQDTPPVLLLYGQSGVGKSSLLEAGIMPRLEAAYEVRYLRRKQEAGLTGTLAEAFPDAGRARTLAEAWAAAEERSGKPWLVILDQVEEVFTRPGPSGPAEMAEFMSAAENLFASAAARPRGKLILSFRKEWLPEIEQQLKARKLARVKIFLERLNREGVVESVNGVTRAGRLSKHYGLTVEDGLAEVIADDLLEDPDSPIAPTLQILLTKMWGEACKKSRTRPHFDRELYQSLKKQGVLLKDFLNQQLDHVRARDAGVVESGLALDVLAFHTTALGTAEQRTREELQKEYRHRTDVLPALIQQYKDLYLLSDPSSDGDDGPAAQPTRLAHDTLAPLIRKLFNMSVAPGQIARRILENRSVEWQGGRTGTPLDERDLRVVDTGERGMRARTDDEERLIEASRVERAARHRARQRRLTALGAGIAAVCIIAFIIVWVFRDSAKARYLAMARSVASKSYELSSTQSELASLLARQAYLINMQSNPKVEPEVQRALRIMDRPVTVGDSKRWEPKSERGGAYIRRITLPTLNLRNREMVERGSFRFNPYGGDFKVPPVEITKLELVINSADSHPRFIVELPKLVSVADADSVPHSYLFAFIRSKLLVSSFSGDPQGTVNIWNLEKWLDARNVVRNQRGTVGEVAQFAAPSRSLRHAQGTRVEALALSPDGQTLAVGTGEREIYLWDLRRNDSRKIPLPPAKQSPASKLEFSPDGRYLVAGRGSLLAKGPDELLLWDLKAAEEKPVVLPVEKTAATELHYTSVDAFAFSPDGKRLAACNGTNVIHVWDFPLTQPTGHSILPAEKSKAGCVMLAFSPDGGVLAVVNSYNYRSSYDLSLWDARSLGQPSGIQLLHSSINISHRPSFMAFTTDGQSVSLVSEGPEETVWEIYSLDYSEISERVCQEYPRNLSLSEWNKFVGLDTPYECTCPSAPKADDAPACRQ